MFNQQFPRRYCEWGHHGITFWERSEEQAAARSREPGVLHHTVLFPGTAQGPCDGTVGSPERRAYQQLVLDWVEHGRLPETVRAVA